jgi:O-antigen/teichoic acid export membrane protein
MKLREVVAPRLRRRSVHAFDPLFVRDVTGTFGATVAVLALGAVQSVIVARALGPTGKGLVTITLLLPSTLALLLDAGVSPGNVYFASRIPLRVLGRHTIVFTVLASAVACALVAIAGWTGALEHIAPNVPASYVVVALAMIPAMLVFTLTSSIIVGLGNITAVNRIRLIQASVLFATTLFAVGVLDLGPLSVLVAALIATVAGAVLALWTFVTRAAEGWKVLGFALSGPHVRDQLRYGLRDHPGNLMQFLNYRLDQFFVSALVGVTALGVYSVAVSIAELLWLLPHAVGTVVFPRAALRRGDDDGTTLRAFRWTLFVTIVAGLGVAVFGRGIVHMLFSARFDRAYAALLLLLPGAVVLGPAKILANDLAGQGHPELNSISAAVGMALTVTLDLVLIPHLGIRGAAVASSVSYVIVGALSLFWFRRLARHPHTA